jgi:hypothetical protein
VAVGSNQCLGAVTSGSYNVAVGDGAHSQSNASYVVAMGQAAAYSNQTNGTVAIGYAALSNHTSGTANTAVGYLAQQANTTGQGNTAVGYEALKTITDSGHHNTAIGAATLRVATSARSNTACGDNSLNALTTGDQNVAVGHGTLRQGTSATQNVCVGAGQVGDNVAAGQAITSGSKNVMVGNRAGYAVTTAERNVFVGYNAGKNHTTGDGRNICIGEDAVLSSATSNREFVYGHNQSGAGADTTMMRGGNGCFNSTNSSSWATTSDERIKKNIVDNNIGLDILNQIQVRNFEYRTEDEIVDFENPKAAVVEKEGKQIGVIAQEIEKILPEVIKTQSTGVKTVDSDSLTWYLINAVKELSAEVQALKAA